MPTPRLISLVPAAIALGLVLASLAPAHPLPPRTSQPVAHVSGSGGGADSTSLPSRVAVSVERAQNSLAAAERSIDAAETAKAITSLKALRLNVVRAGTAALRQMKASAPAESDTPPGPESVAAVLTLDQKVITTLASLYDTKTGTIVTGLTVALVATMNARDRLLGAVIGLSPDGAGADYDDGMADTAGGYADETAGIAEALADDQLSPPGKAALRSALARSKAAQAKFDKRFGGGE